MLGSERAGRHWGGLAAGQFLDKLLPSTQSETNGEIPGMCFPPRKMRRYSRHGAFAVMPAEGLSPPAAPFCLPAKNSSPGSFLGEKMCQKESGGGLRGSPATPSSLPFRLLKGAGQGDGAGRGPLEATLAPNKVRPAPSLRNCPRAPPESVPAATPATAPEV